MTDWHILFVLLITLGNLMPIIEKKQKPDDFIHFLLLVLLAWAWYSVGHAV